MLKLLLCRNYETSLPRFEETTDGENGLDYDSLFWKVFFMLSHGMLNQKNKTDLQDMEGVDANFFSRYHIVTYLFTFYILYIWFYRVGIFPNILRNKLNCSTIHERV